MSVNLIGMQSQAQPLIEAIRYRATSLRGQVTNIYRRYRVWILGAAAVLVVVIAGWIFAHRQSDAELSPAFRTSAQQAFASISSCENYRPYGGDSWKAREIDAELSMADATAHAKTHADLRAAMALSEYLHQVEMVHLARQARNQKTARQEYVESTGELTRELRNAKQKAQTAIES